MAWAAWEKPGKLQLAAGRMGAGFNRRIDDTDAYSSTTNARLDNLVFALNAAATVTLVTAVFSLTT